MIPLLCGILKSDISELIYETNRLTDFENKLMVTKGVGGINIYTLLYIKQINNKVLLCSTGNSMQYPVINHNGKEYEKICICLNHFAVHQKLTQHGKSMILQ